MHAFKHRIFLPLRPGLFASVDADSPEEIWGAKWSANEKTPGRVYAYRTLRQQHVMLHKSIVETSDPEVDHIDGDTLNNLRYNLRPCRHAQNGRNLRKWSSPTSSQYKGVSLRPSGDWRAYISTGGKQKHLGVFETEMAAARAYDAAAKHLFGAFARLNFSNV